MGGLPEDQPKVNLRVDHWWVGVFEYDPVSESSAVRKQDMVKQAHIVKPLAMM